MTHNEIKLVPFEAWHMDALENTDAVDGFSKGVVTDKNATRLLETQDCWTLFDNGGEVIACGGFLKQWERRYIGWMFVTQRSSKYMIRLTRILKIFIPDVKGRIDITVRADFKEGHRWAKMLGFEIENKPGILKQYGPEGEDHIAYVRINK